MKKEIANKWIEALKSGNYIQGKRRLRRDDEFCCLGVLCDISGQGEWKKNSYLYESLMLPVKVREWAGMNSHTGIMKPHLNIPIGKSLSNLNDNGYSFEGIAKVIEEHWASL